MSLGKAERGFVRTEVVLELGSTGGISGSDDSNGGSVAMEDLDVTAPLARDRDEWCVCQVL